MCSISSKKLKLKWLRADSATYQAEVLTIVMITIYFAMGGQLDKSVVKQINQSI